MGWTGANSKRALRALQYEKDRADFKYLGRDAALNDRRTREAARAPARLKEAKAKAASSSSPEKAPVGPAPVTSPKCPRPGCDDWDSGRGLCYAHQLEQETEDREIGRSRSPLRSYGLKKLPEPDTAGVAAW